MATAAQVAEYREANRALVTLAQRDLQQFWSALDMSGDPVRIRNLLLDVFPDLVTSYGDTAAVLGADWYDLLRNVPASAGAFRAVTARPAPTEQAQKAARWGIGPLFVEDPTTALAQLRGSLQRLVMQPGRDAVWDSAALDPVRTGVARVPSGTDTCSFCVMLASRGPIYQSQVNAEIVVGRGSNRTGYDAAGKRLSGGIGGGVKARGNQSLGKKFHDDCDCASVVVRSPADYPAGYDPDHYLDLYQKGSGAGRYELQD